MNYNDENQNIIHNEELKNSLLNSIREEDNDIKSEAEVEAEDMLANMLSDRMENIKTTSNNVLKEQVTPATTPKIAEVSPEELNQHVKEIKETVTPVETRLDTTNDDTVVETLIQKGNVPDLNGRIYLIDGIKNNIDSTHLQEPVNKSSNENEYFSSDEDVTFSDEEPTIDEDDEDLVISDNKTDDEDPTKYYYHSYTKEDSSSKTKGRAFLDKITVDLNNIEIGNTKKAIDQNSDLQLIFNSAKATFSVVCCQSGYRASMLGLTLSEKNALTNSTNDLFESREKLYRIVYTKIDSMSIPKPNYNEWLRMTSFSDLETLLFGIYCQTFIDNNDFDVTCGNCGKTTSVTVDNNSLIEVRNRAIYGPKFNEIAENANTIEKINEISVLNKSERIMLDESKLIVDVTTPSLHDHLSLLKKAKPEVIEKFSDSFSALMFISHMYVLDTSETYKTGIPKYYEITEKSTMLSILNKLSVNDGDQLTDSIEKKLSDYRINYEIHNVECSSCHQKIKGIPISIERILFMRLDRTRTKE